jgi:RNA polymerase sigma-70 factor (ECF subfamily)
VLHDEALERALSRLRPGDRELLYLNAVEGYSTREIGNLIGKPRGTVLSSLHRAKQKLREQIRNHRAEDVDAS